MSPQGNLRLTLGATMAMATAILLLNWHLDPLALKDAGREAVAAGDHAQTGEPFWRKVLAVTHIRPATVILGTSRADAGLDSAHAGFPGDARPVFNLALAGVNIAQVRELLVHAQRARPLKMAVVGLDLESFLPGGRTDFDPAGLAGNADSAPEWMNRLRLNLSWRALTASAERLRPAREAQTVREIIVGARGVFQIAEFAIFHSRLPELFPRWGSGEKWSTNPGRAAAMRAFRDLVSYAHEEGIDLRLFISPVHARYLELYRRVGWWPLFESWKRALVAALAEEAGRGVGRNAFPLWDFAGFSSVTMEALPPAGDQTTQMRWYLDSSHYSREHGKLILDHVLQQSPQPSDASAAAGVLLNADNIEAHLGRVRRDADSYRATHGAEVAELGTTVQFLRRFVRRPP
jgi:hypothetical protein